MLATQFKTISADGSHRSMFEGAQANERTRVIYAFVNARRGLYQVTAKVEYLRGRHLPAENDETMKGLWTKTLRAGDSRRIMKAGVNLIHDALGALASPPRR